MAEAKNIGKARLRDAMDRLFRLGAIERAVLRRDKDKGRDIEGLRRTPNATPGRFPDASHTSPKPTPDQTPNDPHTLPPYYVGAGGAADDGPPPASEPWPEPDTIDLDWDSTGDDE
jgi:hypothetical protein